MFDLEINSIGDSDSYKSGHAFAYPPGMQFLSTYAEARSRKRWNYHMVMGLQSWLMKLKPITTGDVSAMEDLMMKHCGVFNRQGWDAIVNECGGILPLEIEALPEGMIVPVGTPSYQIKNTRAGFGWVPQYVETPALRAVWYASTVGTLSWHVKQSIRAALEISADESEAKLNFSLHDFGARGASSAQTAALGGMAHLVNFNGSDTIPALLAAQEFYGADVAAFNIPALEHSTVCAWGEDREVDCYANAIDRFLTQRGPGSLLSIVPDAYDFRHAVDVHLGLTLRQQIKSSGGKVVVRPDSGDPAQEVVFALNSLAKNFGYTVNSKGYKVLAPCTGVIQGDGITEETIGQLLTTIMTNGFSVENMAFGMGGGLLQSVTRDTLGWAQKANAVTGGHGPWIGIQKRPATAASKTSKKGVQMVIENEQGIAEAAPLGSFGSERNILKPVWRDGELLVKWTLQDLRANSNKYRLINGDLVNISR
jgi:nicotinamide phosphoribosyltransferase